MTTHDPAHRLPYMAVETIAVPLGVVHRRDLLERTGLFDESLGKYQAQDEDGELWRRFAQASARFLPVPARSGRYHVRADSFARVRPPAVTAPMTQSDVVPLHGVMNRPRVMFASYHCYHDAASGAAICTRDLFAALAARGWRCGAFTGPFLDDPAATPTGVTLRDRPGVTSAPGTAGASK